ncbi:cation channel sperm-associated protein 3-like [Brachyhypopomus gauderio]|uniref:cation channel sperm-associated protein 3-like n=1 Tax=Brachyhypopomus gauderio TaxID=698409 RepID=UPI0040438475
MAGKHSRPTATEAVLVWKRRITFNSYVAEITQHHLFDAFITASIILNALFMALETDYNLKYENFQFFKIAEDLFLVVYIMEFLMKLYVDPRAYWKNGYNVFDTIILAVFIITIISDGSSKSLKFIRSIRTFRSLRVIKAVTFIPEIQAIFAAFFKTMRRAMYAVGLTILLLFNFAIIGYFYYGDPDTGDPEDWGDLTTSMFTLFGLLTVRWKFHKLNDIFWPITFSCNIPHH